MSEDEARRLAEERARLRRDHDFVGADVLRDRIRDLGYDVTDTPGGFDLVARIPPSAERPRLRPQAVDSLLSAPADRDATIQWLVGDWPDDVLRGIESFRAHEGSRRVQHVVVESVDLGDVAWPDGADVLRLRADAGWARARNAGLERTRGRIVLVVDGSVEAAGDVLGPIAAALADPAVGVVGPFGVVTSDLREFQRTPGPDCDAIEGYLIGFRRDVLERGIRFDPAFRFYRAADIDLSLRIRDLGLAARVVDVPVRVHEHRAWARTEPDRRARLSRRNLYRLLGRWRGRADLTREADPPDPAG